MPKFIPHLLSLSVFFQTLALLNCPAYSSVDQFPALSHTQIHSSLFLSPKLSNCSLLLHTLRFPSNIHVLKIPTSPLPCPFSRSHPRSDPLIFIPITYKLSKFQAYSLLTSKLWKSQACYSFFAHFSAPTNIHTPPKDTAIIYSLLGLKPCLPLFFLYMTSISTRC